MDEPICLLWAFPTASNGSRNERSLPGKFPSYDFEEGADPSGSLQVRMRDQPQFADKYRDGFGGHPHQTRFEITEIAGQDS